MIKMILPNELRNLCLSKDYKALEGQAPSNHPSRLLFSQCAGFLEPVPSPGVRGRHPLRSRLRPKPSPLRELILSNSIATVIILAIIMLEQGHVTFSIISVMLL